MVISLHSFLVLAAALASTGVAAGLLAGLLGVGGGIVIVPVFSFVLDMLGYAPGVGMHVAVGTSLATIIATSVASLRAHHAKGAVDLELLRRWAPAMFAAAGAGGFAARHIDGDAMRMVFACVAVLVAVNMTLPGRFVVSDRLPEGAGGRAGLPAVIGFVSSLMGIGGGTLSVPLLTAFSYPARRAVGTASAFGLVIAIPATAGFIWSGMGVEGRPAFSLGYVNLLAAALIIPITMVMARQGARIAHAIAPELLKRLFALFLGATALRMFWSIYAAG
ncbi:sulfite exporter TauE/SafE family protein [Camelimonas abortus]|uniref:Probable membrane transporter protein n=1 Tax=Camelimonas abortus TaxID=1017184 RepID=A0ABV7LC42_9HYPH